MKYKFDQKKLRCVPREFDVVYSWLWASPITKDVIDHRLDEMVRAGIKSAYIIPLPKDFRPETLRTFLDPEYLTDEFFELIRYTVEEADKRGIVFWLYDEGGWPSGGANYNTLREYPDAAVDMIKSRERNLHLGESYSAPEDTVAVFFEKKRMPESFTAYKDMTLKEYYIKQSTILPNVIDLTNPTAIDTFISNTYERYKAALGELFAKTPVFFTDEPAVMKNCLPKGGFEIFKERYGYDVRDYIYALDGYGEEATTEEELRARIDYGRMLGELLRDNAFTKLRNWCRDRGIVFGGHLNNDNIAYGGMYCGAFSMVECLRKFDLPGIDVIWEQIRYPHGGRSCLDGETEKFGFFPRLASSAARQTGKVRTLSETFAIYGDGITPEEMKFVLNYQLIRGINRFNFMSMPSSSKRCGALMCRPSFSPEKPGFYDRQHLHEYIERLCYLASLGDAEGDTALYHPAADYWADPKSVIDATESFGRLGTLLESENIPFDIIDDYGIRDAEVTIAGLKLGDATYSHIVVPECKYMPDDVKEKIASYLGKGVPILTPKSDKVRIMTRKIYNSRLWFFFNEGIDTITECFDIKGKQHLYEIDPRSGNVYRRDKCSPTLLCGDIAVYLVTDEIIDTVSDEVDYSVSIDNFDATRHERFEVTYSGCELKRYIGAPEITSDFSGSITYVGDYKLPYEPQKNERYRIRLEDTTISASVSLNGKKVCDLGLLPMSAEISGDMIPMCAKIEIKVSNTAANELTAKKDFIFNTFPKAEVGLYSAKPDKQASFEERCYAPRLGKVIIEKMK